MKQCLISSNPSTLSLQFRKLYQHDKENVEEWMGRLCIVAVECNYQEVDRQLKEQFIHSLNDKHVLEEIIKELTATNNDDHITSGSLLSWAKRVETQRAQVAVLNMLTESRQFGKVKILKRTREGITTAPSGWTTQWQPCRYYGEIHQPRQCPAYGKTFQEGLLQQKKQGNKQNVAKDVPRVQERQN